MADIRTIEPGKYNLSLAQALKKLPEFQKPEWVDFVKTGAHKARPNIDDEFWHKRAASVLRQIYINGSVGVQRLRTRYGGRKNLSVYPSHFKKSGGKIIRVLLQQADEAGLTEKVKAKKGGRQLTVKGKQFLESLA
ncbi:MAG TPA: 40S ribosomal protein S19 [Candidatus Nanoarchaeia archaeon]|nr:40S ribosomal protein S19 [Candidatus Nanoarchaeia archaeon]